MTTRELLHIQSAQIKKKKYKIKQNEGNVGRARARDVSRGTDVGTRPVLKLKPNNNNNFSFSFFFGVYRNLSSMLFALCVWVYVHSGAVGTRIAHLNTNSCVRTIPTFSPLHLFLPFSSGLSSPDGENLEWFFSSDGFCVDFWKKISRTVRAPLDKPKVKYDALFFFSLSLSFIPFAKTERAYSYSYVFTLLLVFVLLCPHTEPLEMLDMYLRQEITHTRAHTAEHFKDCGVSHLSVLGSEDEQEETETNLSQSFWTKNSTYNFLDFLFFFIIILFCYYFSLKKTQFLWKKKCMIGGSQKWAARRKVI